MPQIQYSEKYYDDVYEYRCARIRPRRFPARLDALFDLLHATNGVRARSRGFPRLEGTRDGHDGDAPRDIGLVRGPRYARYTRSSACVSIGTRRDVSAGAFPARASLGIAEPAAYPFEIGSPLTSLPPPPPSTDTSCFPPTSPSSCLRVACSPRYVSEPRYGSTPPPRPNAGDTEARCRNRIAAALDPLPLAREFRATPRSTRARRAKRTAELTRASGFPSSLSDRRSGAVSACSSPAVGCTTPSTGPSPTSCCTGAPPAAVPRALFSNRRRRARGRSRRRAQRRRGDRLASRAFETSPPHRARDSEATPTPTPSTPPSRGTTGV